MPSSQVTASSSMPQIFAARPQSFFLASRAALMVARPARIGHAAAMADVVIAERRRVDDRGAHLLVGDAQLLGGHQAHRGAAAADVGRADAQRHRAVGRQRQRHARLAAVVEPEPAGDAPALVCLQRRRQMRVRLCRLERRDQPDARPGRAIARLRPLARGVLQPHLDRVQIEPSGRARRRPTRRRRSPSASRARDKPPALAGSSPRHSRPNARSRAHSRRTSTSPPCRPARRGRRRPENGSRQMPR